MTNPTQPIKGVTILFDLDGTLIHTAPDLQATLNHVLTSRNFQPVSAEVTNKIIGDGAKAMLRAGLARQNVQLPDQDIDDMFARFLIHYAENIAVNSIPFEGCEDALKRLSDAGAVLSVCTNKTQQLAEKVLKAFNLDTAFAAIVGADSVSARKPDAAHIFETLERSGGDHKHAIMIGDSQTDEKAAHNAGLPFMFVPFGYGSLGDPERAGNHVLSQFSDLSVARVLSVLS